MEHTQHDPAAAGVRRLLTLGFWLIAAATAAALGLDLDGDVLG